MTPHTRLFHQTLIRLIKGIVTAWERWLVAEHTASLPEGTPDDVVNILSKGRKP